jgi:DNA polymerase I-like protein with 3'-5' exonuclease and polymerase domains
VKRDLEDNDGCMDSYSLAGRRRKDVYLYTDALNHPIQGTGADGLKLALVMLHEWCGEHPTAIPIITAHDEIVYECDEDEAEAVRLWVHGVMVEAMDIVVNAEEPKVKIEVESKVRPVWAKPSTKP